MALEQRTECGGKLLVMALNRGKVRRVEQLLTESLRCHRMGVNEAMWNYAMHAEARGRPLRGLARRPRDISPALPLPPL